LFEQLNKAWLQNFFRQIRENILSDIPGTSRNLGAGCIFYAEKIWKRRQQARRFFAAPACRAYRWMVPARFAVQTVTHIFVYCSPCEQLFTAIAGKNIGEAE